MTTGGYFWFILRLFNFYIKEISVIPNFRVHPSIYGFILAYINNSKDQGTHSDFFHWFITFIDVWRSHRRVCYYWWWKARPVNESKAFKKIKFSFYSPLPPPYPLIMPGVRGQAQKNSPSEPKVYYFWPATFYFYKIWCSSQYHRTWP